MISRPSRTVLLLALASTTLGVGSALTACSTEVTGSPTADPAQATTTAPPTTSETPTTTQAPTSTAPLPLASAPFRGSDPGTYYFTTPSGKFECAIFTSGSPIAGCHGEFPHDVPKVAGSGDPDSRVAPNTVEVAAGSPGRFLNSGDPTFHRFDRPARPLPYGRSLSAGEMSCSVTASAGVSCHDSAGHGFTVSDNAYQVL